MVVDAWPEGREGHASAGRRTDRSVLSVLSVARMNLTHLPEIPDAHANTG
jgi:hypothetical protein